MFKIGQHVVCIDAIHFSLIRNDKVYVVSDAGKPDRDCLENWIRLYTVRNMIGVDARFFQRRFRLATTTEIKLNENDYQMTHVTPYAWLKGNLK